VLLVDLLKQHQLSVLVRYVFNHDCRPYVLFSFDLPYVDLVVLLIETACIGGLRIGLMFQTLVRLEPFALLLRAGLGDASFE